MNKEFLDYLLSISEDNYLEFEKNIDICIQTSNNLGEVELDFSWIDIVEKYIPFLKNAVENPYQEILDVADSKKLYENRFLISLIIKLNQFLETRHKEVLKRMNLPRERVIKTKSNVVLAQEDVEIETKIILRKKEDNKNGAAYGLSAIERIERLQEVLSSIIINPFFISLQDIKLVSSPIQRSTVIMEDPNFKRLLELWDFLENYLLVQKTVSNKKIQDKRQELLENKAKNTAFVNYQLFNSMNLSYVNEEYYHAFLDKIIENIVAEGGTDDKTFKKMVNKKFEESYAKKQNKEKNIQAIFNKSIDNYQKQIKDAIRCLK